jgi:hypothetical protein
MRDSTAMLSRRLDCPARYPPAQETHIQFSKSLIVDALVKHAFSSGGTCPFFASWNQFNVWLYRVRGIKES